MNESFKHVSRLKTIEAYARYHRVWLVFLSSSEEIPEGASNPVPFLSRLDVFRLNLEGELILEFRTEEEAWYYYSQVVGDEGPTRTNPYNGPLKVFACLNGPDGGITENT